MILDPALVVPAELTRLAVLARRLTVASPDAAATARLSARFEALTAGRERRGAGAWIAAWLGAGPHPRGLAQRLAAGALLVSAVGAGASVATGIGLGRVASATESFLDSVVQNLAPHNGDTAQQGVVPGTPTDPGPPAAGVASPVPSPSVTATPSASPQATPPPAANTPVAGGVSSGASGRGVSSSPSTPEPAVAPSATPVGTSGTPTDDGSHRTATPLPAGTTAGLPGTVPAIPPPVITSSPGATATPTAHETSRPASNTPSPTGTPHVEGSGKDS